MTNAIELKNVIKKFRIYHEKKNTIFDNLVNILNRENHFEELVILDDVSLSVKKGEMLGVIGRNGSGKTTLLRLMAKIFRPDTGTVQTNGTIIPLLELGIGFQGDMTVLDNIIQYGVILGFTTKEMETKCDQILQFAELEKYSDTRLKHLSSGMIARLAFATAVQADPEILLVDEVLAVGDLPFQEKSYKTFLSLKEKKTIVYVSHNIDSVKKLCDSAIFLDKGKIASYGEPNKVVDDYLRSLNGQSQ